MAITGSGLACDPDKRSGWAGSGFGTEQAKMCAGLDVFKCASAAWTAADAGTIADRYFKRTNRREHNAMTHAYWIGSLSLETDADWARQFGIAHEIDKSDGVLDTRKDLINNERGIALAAAWEESGSAAPFEVVVHWAATNGYLACQPINGTIAGCGS